MTAKARIEVHRSSDHDRRDRPGLLEPGPSLNRLRADLRKDFHPGTPAEEVLVADLARCLLLEDRAGRLLYSELEFPKPDAALVRTMRRSLNNADRCYYRILEKLRNLQQRRELEEIGFVWKKTKSKHARRYKR